MNYSTAPCFFQADHIPVSYDADRTEISVLLFGTAPPSEFRSMLEYLLYRAGCFHLQHTNLCQYKICTNHYDYLTSRERNNSCRLCKTVRGCPTVRTTHLQAVTKSLALQVWKEGRPVYTWVVYAKPVCSICRKYFDRANDTNAMRSTSEHCPSEPASQHSNYEPQFEDLTNSRHPDYFELLKRCLVETRFTGRIQKISSFTKLTEHSLRNVQTQTLKILLANDAEEVWKDIIDTYQSNSHEDQS
ncbi:unnamed protein product [Adineta ricciae]|uniref:Uncharacterized protein n=1 Tax=Adineta ricciae TaxID=249248 RepID=A0A815R4P2_ADIRI|nr:unnamed protein product [Adineta ricciae]